MKPKHVAIIIAVVFIGLLIMDAFLYTDSVSRNSLSQVIIDAAAKSALVPWFVGLVMGFLGAHWFDNYREGDKQ